MLVKTLLNYTENHKSFVYGTPRLMPGHDGEDDCIEVPIVPRANGHARCSQCERVSPGYDMLAERRFNHVPLWGIAVVFLYTMRRVDCPDCGVKVEKVPWSSGKQHTTHSLRLFLAFWAQRLSWSEVANVFQTSWDTVFSAVEWVVAWGRENQSMEEVSAIGVDEIAYKKGHRYLTMVYQIGDGCRRLLWIGEGRTKEALAGFFDPIGDLAQSIKFVSSDMWKAYREVIAERLGHAVHVLDRFHIVAKLNATLDHVRRDEMRRLKANGEEGLLKGTRWCLLSHPENLTDRQALTMKDLLKLNLRTVRAYLMKDDFRRLWTYKSPYGAGCFLDQWCTRAMRSRIEPLKAFARSMRTHRKLVLNWFTARGEIHVGAVEGFNNKAKLAIRKAYGYRTRNALETALYHQLGYLPVPKSTHRYC